MIFRNICLSPFAFFLDFLFMYFAHFSIVIIFFLIELFFNTKMISSLCAIVVTGIFLFVICILFLIYGNFTWSNLLILFSLMYFTWLAFSSLKFISLDHDDDSLLSFYISFLSLLHNLWLKKIWIYYLTV